MRSIDAHKTPNIFAKNDPRFENFHTTMNSSYRGLRAQGIGADKHSSEPFSKEEENLLWTSGVFCTDNPVGLQKAVFFYNGKIFCLRGGNEHRSLMLSQLKRVSDGYIYTENASKNRPGGISQLKLKNKCVTILENDNAGERCHTRLLDKYIHHLPEKAKKENLFYVRPLEKPQGDIWYSSVPLGKNKLAKMVANMCADAGIGGHKTNHSLRATGATELYTAGVPEKIIQERTGHRSLECLRMYEKTSERQQKAVSKILSSTEETSFVTQLENKEKESMPADGRHAQNSACVPTMNFNNCSVSINYNVNQGASTVQLTSSTQKTVTK